VAAPSKDTIYIDVDEEITGIVSKIQGSPKDIVALVLPKRASVLQSIVNMKLLKRSAEQNNKKLVLITSETRILPLAGAVGLFVASNLTSKPYIPPSPNMSPSPKEEPLSSDGEISPETPVSAVAPDAKFADSDEIEIDNTPKIPAAGAAGAVKAAKAKGGSKLKVPNFSKFRKKLIFGGVLGLALIFGLVYGIFIAPKAKITVKAQTSEIPLSLDFVADTKATEFDKEGKVLRASEKQSQNNDSEKIEATGQKDKGNKASGTMTLQNCTDNPANVPAGTGVSSGEYTFITQSAVTLDSGDFTSSGDCKSDSPKKNVAVIAQEAGEKYNLSSRSYSVAGRSGIKANGSAMSGGTTQIVRVISQGDVDKAKERLNGKLNNVQEEMKQDLQKDGYLPINDSFKSTPGTYNVTPAVDSEANEVTVSVTMSYVMLGVKEDDLKEIIKDEISKTEEGKDQSVLSEGLAQATIKPSTATGGLDEGQVAFIIETNVITGPDVNHEEIKQQLAGKKSGESEEILKLRPGLQDPKVELSPFWVSKVPKKHSKITIEVQQADGSQIP